ncbi:DUF317 domain-containing protein [Streptomyces sp. CC208A]|uniref:DUF317 domain-containing protein n=1 Tax=Streptomyces sp. CC208A TaxID=3044573 RepID=UPI0024A7F613|nr:DUF317 domain-containing protein [Streptomyces sp. CC208A]
MTYTPEGDVYVSPRYLAGPDWCADAGFVPVKHWPTVHLEHGSCQMLITSPDQRIRIGWYGDDFDVYKITASEDASSPTRWSATFNDIFPTEIVAAFTTALERDWEARKDQDPFIEAPSPHWATRVQPLLDAGWQMQRLPGSVTLGRSSRADGPFVEVTAPDGTAGVSIDVVSEDLDAETVLLWAGSGWHRAEARFTSRTPAHLIAATTQALLDPAPVLRYREHLAPELAALAKLTPLTPPKPPAPTPLEVQRARRHTPAITTRSVPRWSTTSRPPTTIAPPAVRAARR